MIFPFTKKKKKRKEKEREREIERYGHYLDFIKQTLQMIILLVSRQIWRNKIVSDVAKYSRLVKEIDIYDFIYL